MKAIFISQFYRYGSTGKSIERRYNAFRERGVDVNVLYGWKKQEINDPNIFYYGNYIEHAFHMLGAYILGLQGSMSNFSTNRIIRHIKRFKPDVVWVNNLHGFYLNEFRLLNFLKKQNIWVIYSMPDEYAFMGKCFNSVDCEKYKTECGNCPRLKSYPPSYVVDNSRRVFLKKAEAYKDFDKIVFRSAPFVVSKAAGSFLLKNHLLYANVSSVDLEKMYYQRDELPNHPQLNASAVKNKRIVINAAQFKEPLKGVKYFYEAAKRCDDQNILFINIGCGLSDAEIQKYQRDNFIFAPYIHDQNEMARYYSIADAYVCTSIADGMPNTCLEALGCGTPIIGFNASGVPFVADDVCGTFVAKENVDELTAAIQRVKKKDCEIISYCRNYALSRFDARDSVQRLYDFFKFICDNRDDYDRIRDYCDDNLRSFNIVK